MQNSTRQLLQAVSAYVPDHIVRYLIAHPGDLAPGRGIQENAVLLFADVSGFTTMSENLAQLGKEGAEELTRVLNDYFSTMIDLVTSYGGEVIKFSGDAITCHFSNGPTGVARACGCALAMQDRMADFRVVKTSGGDFALRMKIGISAGKVLSVNVGTLQEGLEYVLAGHALDRMALAEHHATAGEVVIDTTCPALNDVPGLMLGESRDGFRLVTGLSQPVTPQPRPPLVWDELDEPTAQRILTQLAAYLPPSVYEQICDGQRQFVGDNRQVVSLFVRFQGLDYDHDPQAAAKLQRYFTTMQTIINRYGGRLNRVSTGDKGSLLHLIFGAPVAYEDNEERAMGCALEMQRVALKTDLLSFITGQRIGAASGYVFAGNVGSDRRREYTVMGDVVNLSARLMQAAQPGQILCNRHTARRVTEEFMYEFLPPIRVKGKQAPVAICQVIGLRQEIKRWGGKTGHALRNQEIIVGRERELQQIAEIIAAARSGQGQTLVISGEAGVGKSHLLDSLITMAGEQEMYGLQGDSRSYGSQSPYLPWIDLLNAFFGLTPHEHESYDQKLRRITQRMVAVSPSLEGWVPLIAQLLGLPTPDNDLTAALDAQLRKQRIFELVLTLLRHQARQVPLFLLVFEDTHWIDDISRELLDYVARNIGNTNILLVVVGRLTTEFSNWRRYRHTHWIALEDLPAADALELLRRKLHMETVPQELRDRVLGGEERINPFFVEEVLNALIDQGYLVPLSDDPEAGYAVVGDLSAVEIPDSIQALIMSRIDRLDESSKLTVKVASAIGRTFRYRTLKAIYPVNISQEKLWENLDRLGRADITPLDKPAPDWEYIFKHATIQEVAYESLLYKHRRELHHAIASYLERTHADNLAEYYDLLAHHYFLSGDQEKSWIYLVKAGDRARARYANQAAIARYTDALSLESVKQEDKYPVYDALGDVYQLIGQYDQARESYRQALDCHPGLILEAATRRKIAKTWALQGEYSKAGHYLSLTKESLESTPATLEMARIYCDIGWIAVRQGEYDQALASCEAGLVLENELPQDKEAQQVKAELQNTLGSIYVRTGEYERAIEHFQASVRMRQNIGDLYGIGRSYNNIAAVYWGQGNYDQAIRYINNSLEIFHKIGYTHGIAMGYNNLGAAYFALRDYPKAIEYYQRSLKLRQEINDLRGIAGIYNNLGEVYRAQGELRSAGEYLRQAITLLTEIGEKWVLCDAHKLLSEVELSLNHPQEAREHAQISRALSQELGDRAYEGRALRILGQIQRSTGDLDGARQYLRQSVELLTSAANKLELGRSHYELGMTLLAQGDAEECRAHLQEAAQIFAELQAADELAQVRTALESARTTAQ